MVFSEDAVTPVVVGDDVHASISICCGVNGCTGCGTENDV
jgi:hypothetical protein